jgi:choline dehydrogenase
VPAAVGFLIENPVANWCHYTAPIEALGGRRLYAPAGKLLGGSSALNGMIYNRGQSLDYDAWSQAGCTGWSYSDVLDYFKKIETTSIGSDDYRGRAGPVHVEFAEKLTPFFDRFIAAAQNAGIPLNDDLSGPTQHGVTMAQHTVHRGLRQSTATQYLDQARGRPNLTVFTGAEAMGLLLEGNRCVGVRVHRRDRVEEIRATREVILSAGSFGSPKLLELSGIGDPDVLKPLGIDVVHALPGVGRNLRDHYGPTLQWSFSEPGLSIADKGRGLSLLAEILRYGLTRRGFLAQGWATMRAFVRSAPGIEQADIALMASPFLLEVVGKKRLMSKIDGFSMFAQVQRPESVGYVHVRSANFRDPIVIHPEFLATERDRQTAIMAVRKAREIVAAPPLAGSIQAELQPGLAVQSDDEILDFVRQTGATTYHFSGTCKMGVDPLSVVDERLQVRGMQGLRVADASIMPMIVSGNTSIPCMMIGEKCADMVLEASAAAG